MPLDDTQLKALAALIAKRREELRAEIRADVLRARSDSAAILGGEVRDAGDESVADLLIDTENAETTRDIGELRAIELAGNRLATGHYGLCERCGTDIPFERLLANPAAIRCFVCQSNHERTHAHPDEPRL